MAAQTYTLAPGAEIHWAGGVLSGGNPVPAEYLATLPDGGAAMVKAGMLVPDAAAPVKDSGK